MLTTIYPTFLRLQKIIQPYASGEEKELPFYNVILEAKIAKIRDLIPTLEVKEAEIAAQWVLRLQNQIETNNHYVARKKTENRNFTLCFCTLTGDLAGFKFLLRIGENPNVLEKGKAAIHIAAAKNLQQFVAVLKECPQFELELKNRFGKTAREIANFDEMKQLLS